MPPKATKAAATGDAADGRKQPTPQEAFLFYNIIKNMKGKPEVDWTAVAADAGFKNAETAKVRYGQIKRKLGLDNWTSGKAKDSKDEEDGDGAGLPETPAGPRTKKSVTTPSGSGTNSGVKKRASVSKTPGSRSRKAKSQAIIKMEELEQDENDDAVNNDDEMIDFSTPSKKKNVTGLKTEFNTNLNYTGPDYSNFPASLPEVVLRREAILVNLSGTWTVSPAPIDVHSQWLAQLPAHIQTRFYSQAHGVARGATTDAEGENEVNAQLLGEPFNAAAVAATHFGNGQQQQQLPPMHGTNLPMPLGMAVEMGYLPAPTGGPAVAAVGNGSNGAGNSNNDDNNITQALGGGGEITAAAAGLHSVPMHPMYREQMLERETREQEARDQAALFGGQDGF
ncbi:hypothetical protein C8A00DRAFT_13716 [Chaetomidium leptoderma]|uniref:Myb-like DNA-binding domain-containing protein n=1 Tax=Chaetomidium leptoderma TaxID=669021 RepID=A0AAN7A005_9PEZI|nr:hypothetical protein C8A00DRAFT_13716 [Chaetomidium leptoderma]